MKKLILPLLAGLALITAGCSEDEIVDAPLGKAVEFSTPFFNKTGRATDYLRISNVRHCKVWGSSLNSNSFIFDGELLSVTSGGGVNYGPPRYWEASNTYHFAAIAESLPRSTQGDTPAAGNSWTFTPGEITSEGTFSAVLTFDNSVAGGEIDLGYATADRTTEATLTELNTADKVPLNFEHMLSRLRFEFQNAMDEGYYLEIVNLNVNGLPMSGDFLLPGETWQNVTGSLDKSLPTVQYQAEMDVDYPKFPVGYTLLRSSEFMFSIPTNVDFEVSFGVNLYLKNDAGEFICMNDSDHPYEHRAAITQDLEMATAYLFKAVIGKENLNPEGMYPIVFSASVLPSWDSSTIVDLGATIPNP